MKYTSILLAVSLCVCLPLSLLTHAMLGIIPSLIGVFAVAEHRITKKSFPVMDRDFCLFFGLLVTVGVLSALWSIAPEASMIRSFKLAGVFLGGLLLLAGMRSFAKAEREFVLRPIPIVLLVTILAFLIEVRLGYPIFLFFDGAQETMRYTLYITNWTAVILAILFWPGLQYMISTQQKKLAITISILILFVIYFSTSESAILGFLVGAIVFLVGRYIKSLPLLMFVGLSAGLVASPWIAHGLFILRPEFLVDLKGASAGQRMEIWDFLARQIFDKPVLGWGVESARAMTLDTEKLFYRGTGIYHPHNAALQLWLEMGIAGVLLGIGFLGLLFKRIASTRPNIYMMAGFSSVLMVSLTAYGLWQGWWLGVMFITAALFRLVNDYEDQIRETTTDPLSDRQ